MLLFSNLLQLFRHGFMLSWHQTWCKGVFSLPFDIRSGQWGIGIGSFQVILKTIKEVPSWRRGPIHKVIMLEIYLSVVAHYKPNMTYPLLVLFVISFFEVPLEGIRAVRSISEVLLAIADVSTMGLVPIKACTLLYHRKTFMICSRDS